MKKYLSFILPAFLFVGICILAYRKIFYLNDLWINLKINFDIIIVSIYLLWILFEFKVSINDVKQEIKISDYGSREFYGISHALTIFSALWLNPLWQDLSICHIIGFILLIIGASFRAWAIMTLGQHYSHIVRKHVKHKIIDKGPYHFIRHPAYAGMIIAHLGITLFYFNLITLLIYVLLLIPSIIIRIIIEEKTLITIDGYHEFAKKRNRVIPFIW